MPPLNLSLLPPPPSSEARRLRLRAALASSLQMQRYTCDRHRGPSTCAQKHARRTREEKAIRIDDVRCVGCKGDGSKEAPRNRLLLLNEQRGTLALQHRNAPETVCAAGTMIRKRSASAAARKPILPIPAAEMRNARAGRAHTPRAPDTRLSLTLTLRQRWLRQRWLRQR